MADDQTQRTAAVINLPAIERELQTPGQIADYFTRLEREINGALGKIEQNIRDRVDIDTTDYLDPFQKLVVARASATTITITGTDARTHFPEDRRVRLTRSDTGATQVGFVSATAATYSAPTTTVTITLTTGTIDTATDKVEVASSQEQKNISYRDLSTAAKASVAVTADVGQAAFVDFAGTPGTLGSAATVDHGTASGDAPLNSDLGSASLKNHGDTIGLVPLNTVAAPLAALAYDGVPAQSFTELSVNKDTFATFGGWEWIPTMFNIAVPGSPDGSKKYKVACMVTLGFNDTSASDIGWAGIAVYTTQGGVTTSLVGAGSSGGLIGNQISTIYIEREITPVSGDDISMLLGVSTQAAAADEDNFTVYSSASGSGYSTNLLIEEILQ